jgi:hypothetical protein
VFALHGHGPATRGGLAGVHACMRCAWHGDGEMEVEPRSAAQLDDGGC